MQQARPLRRSILLTVSLLSACAASDVSSRASAAGETPASAPAVHMGAAGSFLVGRFAATQNDMGYAADQFMNALALDPGNQILLQQSFLATLLTGREEAVRLARLQPSNPAAELLLGDTAAASGNWEQAEAEFQGLPKQGLTQVLQPLLLAWAEQGAGHSAEAIATLKPYMDGQRFQAIYLLHAALISDLANNTADAARYYAAAEKAFGTLNLQLARMVASFEARHGNVEQAQKTMHGLLDASDNLALSAPALEAGVAQRQVTKATDGMAEAYLALAAALHAQDANDFAVILLRLAIDIRPDFTPARLLAAEIVDDGKFPIAALQMLAPVPADDPLIGVVRLRRAALTNRLGNTEDALKMLDQMAHDYPTRPEPLAMKGDILRVKGRFADAVTAYDGAIARVGDPRPDFWPLFYDRGMSLERAHDWPRAEADFKKALQLAPDQPYVLNYLGYSWTEQGRNLGEARKMIERAVALRPNDGSIVDSLGWVTLRQGDVAGAVKALERAVELDPEDSTVNGHLGDAYWAAGRKLEAQYQWRLALALHPEPEDVPKLEAKLRDGDTAMAKSPTAEKSTTQ